MTPEERFERIDRQLEFLANHQAHLSARFDQLVERFDELGQFLLKTARMLEGFARRTEARIDGVEESLRRLAEAGARTDERLNVLIHVVERHFSNGRQT